MIEMRYADQRGDANHGWLHSKHTFSFAHYFDPKQQGFSDLLVINDDQVAPARGFGMHPHKNMEIFSYVLDGALEHKDSMGTGSVIQRGDVQMMSAGSGVRHSEFNHSASDKVHFLQIWIVPNQLEVLPRYQQVHFSDAEKRGQLRLIISPHGEHGSLSAYQDIFVYAGLFNGAEQDSVILGPNRYAYIYVAKGSIKVNGQLFNEGDGARVRHEESLHLSDGHHAEVLVFNLRPNELPEM